MSDISAYKPSERIIEIVHPGRNAINIGVRVTLMSIADERMKKTKRTIQNRKLQLDARGKNFKADEIEENRNDVTYSAMTGWQWYKIDKDGNEAADGEQATFHGKVPAFNRKDVYAVFDELSWFRDQIDEAIGEEKDFFAQSAPS
jgi:hypothetical protein